jgi:hypothetical protein
MVDHNVRIVKEYVNVYEELYPEPVGRNQSGRFESLECFGLYCTLRKGPDEDRLMLDPLEFSILMR